MTRAHTQKWSPQSDRYVAVDRVWRTCLIEVGVVDAHPKLSVCLGDDDGVRQPHWVVDLLDEARVEQLPDLLTDEVLPLYGLSPRLLPHRLGVGADL